jgi:hypothetical protein
VPDSNPKSFASNAFIKTRRGSPSVSPQKPKLSKLNLADNLLIGAISYLLYFSKPLALCSCIASIFRGSSACFPWFLGRSELNEFGNLFEIRIFSFVF